MNWREERLANLVEINPPSVKTDEEFVSFIPMQSISEIEKRIIEIQTRPLSEVSKGYTQFKNGDLLLAKITPCFENGKQAIVNIPSPVGYGSSEFHVFRKKSDQIDIKFLHYFFQQQSFRNAATINMTGTAGQKRVPASFLSRQLIHLPPLEVQKKIAAVLEKADELRRKREEQIKRLDDLLQATFLDMFGDPVTNPKGWKETVLDKIADIKSGVTKGRKLKGKIISVPYMRVANVQDGKICLDEIKEIEIQENELEKYALQYGDILLTEGGDPDKLGRGAVWLNEIDPCIHQNHIFRVRPNESEVLPEFLSALIGSSRGKRYFFRSAKQTTGIASINMTQLKRFPALVPPLSKQKVFQNFIVRHQATIKAFSKLEERTTCLFNSLMQRAFKGELDLT